MSQPDLGRLPIVDRRRKVVYIVFSGTFLKMTQTDQQLDQAIGALKRLELRGDV